MKQKQKKVTIVQVRALEKKFIALENRRCAIVLQTATLKVVLRKYIQQNMEEIATFAAGHGQGRVHRPLHWAVDKIRRGYFGDANLKKLIEIVSALRRNGLLERK